MLIGKKLLVVSVAALSVGLLGFTKLNLQAKNINDQKAEALLSRSIGQAEFANPVEYALNLESGQLGRGMPQAAAAAPPGQQRAVQEADVFKIGKKGSKLLYLLNSLRGLQIVSYADGVEKPKMIARVEATGNMPRDMYYVESRQRLVVLENVYFDRSGKSQYSENQARLVIYDVSNDQAPKIEQVVEFKGAIRDSRLVGDILYVGSSIEPNWRDFGGARSTRTGMVQSFWVGSGQAAQIMEYQLSLPMSYYENMNIVEVKKDGGYLYYIVAVLESSSWNFWSSKSVIEVVDISDAHGKIEAVMKVGAKGNVRERSQTLIKDDTLVVVSNYQSEIQKNAQGRPITRVAVESFKLPTATADVITESEAQFRQLWVDRELAKAKLLDEDAIDAKRKELLADKDYGLTGRFVQTKSVVSKPYADSTVTVGDTTGMSTDLRDVRVDGNNLYVFWVPTNNVDPLDLFDLSDLSKGVKYVSRLQFEGWIERAVPFTVQGRQFILGLGWIIPAQDNERGGRKAQASLFEIYERSGKKTSIQLAQIELSEQGAWSAGFMGQDKYLDVRDNGNGTGTLLFSQYAKVGSTWKEGGKVVSYDFNKVLADKADQFFTEGGFLVGDSNWIKRIFTNTEINRINAFSDMSLATYQDSSKLTAGGLVQAANILELARNIKAFELMGEAQKTVGVQVVAKGYIWGAEAATTEVRVTTAKLPDAELKDGMNVTTLAGAYAAHVKLSPTSLLVYTNKIEYIPWSQGETRRPKTEHNVYLLKFDGQKSVLADSHKWTTEESQQSRFGFRGGFYPGRYSANSFVKLSDGSYLLSGAPSLKVFKAAQGLTATEYQYKDCPVVSESQQQPSDQPRVSDVSVRALGGQLYIYHSVVQQLGKTELAYARNYLSPLSFNKEQAICGQAVNIPGEPLSLEGDNLVTSDTQALDVVTYMRPDWQDPKKMVREWKYLTSQALASVKLAKTSSSLEDMQISDDSLISSMKKIAKNEYLYVKSPAMQSWRSDDYPAIHQLVFVGLNNYKFKTVVRGIYLQTSMSQDIASVLAQGDSRLLVLTSGNGVRVLKWNVKDLEPSIVPLKTSSAFGPGEFDEAAYIPSYFYGLSDGSVAFDTTTNALLFPLGTAGVKSIEMKK